MRKIGEISIKFEKEENGVLYYGVKIKIENRENNVILPRYHPFLGWIEIFGFPPQNEWCVLKRLPPFEREANLQINGENLKEKIIFNPDFENKLHFITTIRKCNESFENFFWFEDFSKAPEKIKGIGIFSHNNGNYYYVYEKKGVESSKYGEFKIENIVSFLGLKGENLSEKVKEMADEILKDKGLPDSAWIQKFKAKGEKPPIYYKMFPLENLINIRNCKGKTVQLGYLNKEGELIDKIHGEWYKFFEFDDGSIFFIKESGWSSLEIKIQDKKERIKNTYKMELFLI